MAALGILLDGCGVDRIDRSAVAQLTLPNGERTAIDMFLVVRPNSYWEAGETTGQIKQILYVLTRTPAARGSPQVVTLECRPINFFMGHHVAITIHASGVQVDNAEHYRITPPQPAPMGPALGRLVQQY